MVQALVPTKDRETNANSVPIYQQESLKVSLYRHQSLIDPGVSPTCRLCGEEAECSWHVIGRCPMLRTKRWEYLGGFELENPPDWSPSKLLKFLLKAKIDEMNEREDNIFSQIL